MVTRGGVAVGPRRVADKKIGTAVRYALIKGYLLARGDSVGNKKWWDAHTTQRNAQRECDRFPRCNPISRNRQNGMHISFLHILQAWYNMQSSFGAVALALTRPATRPSTRPVTQR